MNVRVSEKGRERLCVRYEKNIKERDRKLVREREM